MKKIIVLLLALAMVFSLTACKSDTTGSTGTNTAENTVTPTIAASTDKSNDTKASTTGEVKVAFIAQDLSNPSMAYALSVMKEDASKYGYTVTGFDEANDSQKGVDAVGTCIAQGYKAILVNPSDPSAIAPALKEAKDAGIIVGMFSSDLSEENQQYRDFFCGTNDTEAGQDAAAAIIKQFPDGCNVVEIGGQSGHDAQVKRADGFTKGLEGSNINVLASQNCDAWATDDAMAIMEDFITKYGNQIDAVFCHWDNGATGVINALANAGIEGVYIVAIDGCSTGFDQVKAGTQSVSIGQSFSNMVLKSFDCIQAAMNGTDYEKINWIPLDTITSDNVNELPYPKW